MVDDDRFTRITLRIPKDLHSKLSVKASDAAHSMNAEIVQRLEASFSRPNADAEIESKVAASVERLYDEIVASLVNSIKGDTTLARQLLGKSVPRKRKSP